MIHAPQLNPNERRWLFILGGVGSALAINNTLPAQYRVQHLLFPHPRTPSAPSTATTVPVTGHPTTTAAATQGLVKTTYTYRFNHFSCLYFYEKVGHYADGSTKNLGLVVRQDKACQGLPPVQYVYLTYLSHRGDTYRYAVMAVFQNGTQKQVGVYAHAGALVPTAGPTAKPVLVIDTATVGGS